MYSKYIVPFSSPMASSTFPLAPWPSPWRSTLCAPALPSSYWWCGAPCRSLAMQSLVDLQDPRQPPQRSCSCCGSSMSSCLPCRPTTLSSRRSRDGLRKKNLFIGCSICLFQQKSHNHQVHSIFFCPPLPIIFLCPRFMNVVTHCTLSEEPFCLPVYYIKQLSRFTYKNGIHDVHLRAIDLLKNVL